jgi:hypothetical protein
MNHQQQRKVIPRSETRREFLFADFLLKIKVKWNYLFIVILLYGHPVRNPQLYGSIQVVRFLQINLARTYLCINSPVINKIVLDGVVFPQFLDILQRQHTPLILSLFISIIASLLRCRDHHYTIFVICLFGTIIRLTYSEIKPLLCLYQALTNR